MWTKVMRRKNTLGEYQFEAGKLVKGFQRGVPATSARTVGRNYLVDRTIAMRQMPLGPPTRDFVQSRKSSLQRAYGVIGRTEVPTFGSVPVGHEPRRRGQHAGVQRHKSGFLKRYY